MANALQNQIQDLVSKFSSDLEKLIRVAAVEAVQGVLGGSSPAPRPAALPRAPKAPGKKRGPKPGAKKAKVTGRSLDVPMQYEEMRSLGIRPRPKDGKKFRRSAEQRTKDVNAIIEHVTKNPGSKAESIAKALHLPPTEWTTSIKAALDTKKIVRDGERRGTSYRPATPAIAKPSPVPPIKRQK